MFKVATYNVNSIRSRLHIVIPWLKENRPDVLCMQETKVENRLFPESYFHRIGYHVVFSGSKGRNGVAIASLEEPSSIEYGLDSSPKDEDRIIKVEISGITIVNTYIPQGYSIDSPKYKYKIEWLRRLRDYFKRKLRGDTIWCGDMNVAPEPIDVYDPVRLKDHVCFHFIARKEYKRILEEFEFVDLLRKHHPNERIYTYYDYRIKDSIKKGLGWRIDAILASKPLAEKSVDCYVDIKTRLAEKPSDHLILVAELDI